MGCLFSSHAQNNKNIDPCKIDGAVYIEKNRVDATYRVFVEESQAFANLIVYKQDNKLYADQPGNWYFTPSKGFADFSIYIETNKAFADFSIYYTKTESFAGCNN
ncbi:MAG: hypothetical protein RL060_1358 [Bacteroidota bacterium]